MKTRVNQLAVEILLLIVISAVLAFICIYLMDVINMFGKAVENNFNELKLGF